MKKLLALLLLVCLLAPACALAVEFSITDADGDTPTLSGAYYMLSESGSPYTMRGDSTSPIRLNLSGGGEVTVNMEGVSIRYNGDSQNSALYITASDGTSLALNLSGEDNSLTSTNSSKPALYFDCVQARITGPGLLSVEAQASGISLSSSTLTVQGGARITATTDGMYTGGVSLTSSSMTVQGEQTRVDASSTYKAGRGVSLDGSQSSLTIRDGAQVTAKATGEYNVPEYDSTIYPSYGIRVLGGGSLTVEGGAKLTAEADIKYSVGISATDGGSLTVKTDGNFEAYGTETAVDRSGGLTITVEGGIRRLYGQNSGDLLWTDYSDGMNCAKVLPEYVPAPEGPTGGGLINPGVVVPGGAIPMPDGAASDLPKTGDTSMLGAWVCLMLAALMSLAAMKLRRARG